MRFKFVGERAWRRITPYEGEHFCVECGEKSNDWMVARGLIPPEKSWCGDCKERFVEMMNGHTKEN